MNVDSEENLEQIWNRIYSWGGFLAAFLLCSAESWGLFNPAMDESFPPPIVMKKVGINRNEEKYDPQVGNKRECG